MNTINGSRKILGSFVAVMLATGCNSRTSIERVGRIGQALTAPPVAPLLFEAPNIPPSEALAEFFGPTGMVVVNTGFRPTSVNVSSTLFNLRSLLFVLDTLNSTIRRVEPDNGATTTLAGLPGIEGAQDGDASVATFRKPRAVTASADALFLADTDNHLIRRVEYGSQAVTTLAGSARKSGRTDGVGAAARFSSPSGIAYAPDTNTLYISDTGNSLLRKITFDDPGVGTVSTLTGLVDVDGGGSTPAVFNRPTALLYDGSQQVLFVADAGNHTVRRVDLQNGQVTTLAGQTGVAGASDGSPGLLVRPAGLAQTAEALYVTDASTHTIRRIALDGSGPMTTLVATAGRSGNADGSGPGMGLRSPSGVAVVKGVAYVADQGNHKLRRVGLQTAQGETLVGTGRAGSSDGWPESMVIAPPSALTCDAQRVYVDGAAGTFSIEALTGSVRVLSPLNVPSSSLAVASQWLHAESGYGRIGINLMTLERSHVAPVLESAFFQFVAIDDWLYAMFEPNESPQPKQLELISAPVGSAAINPPPGINAVRTAADGTYVYGTVESVGQARELWRFPAGASGPLEKFTGYPYDERNSFGVARGYVYMGQGSTIVRHALPSGGTAVGAVDPFAGSSTQPGALDGHLSEARFDGLRAPSTFGTSSPFCLANGSLYTVEYPPAGHFRIRTINLDTETVSTIVPHECTRILLDDFADGLAGWTYDNGSPGDRSGKWDDMHGDGRYVFFFEPGEGGAGGNKYMTRTLMVRPLAAGGTRLAWDFHYAFGGTGGDVTATFEVRVTPQGACANQTPVNLQSTFTTADADTDASGFKGVEGTETLSIDVSAFEGCSVQVEVLGSHSAQGNEAGGYLNIDDVRLEWKLCEN